MPMRLSGLMSGMDTDSVIQELVAARRTKVDDAKKAQKKLSWKQDAWKSLNTKLKNLQSKYLNNMRFSTAYMKRTTKVSNSNIVSVITGENAVNGVQSLEVNKLAKTGYLTGGKISGTAGDLTALSKLSEITGGLTAGENGTISVTSGGKSVDINVNGDTTISDVLTQLKDAGLNASFDAKQQRFFVSAKESGVDNDFSITASDATGAKALSVLGLQVDLSKDEAAMKEYETYSKYYVAGDRNATLANMSTQIDAAVNSRVDGYLAQYKSLTATKKAAEDRIKELEEKYKDNPLDTLENYATKIDNKTKEIKAKEESMKDLTGEELAAAEKELKTLNDDLAKLSAEKTDRLDLNAQEKKLTETQEQMKEVTKYVDITEETDGDGNVTYTAAATAQLTDEVETSFYNKAEFAYKVINENALGSTAATGATKVNGQDAEIMLNGAVFTNSTNVFEINGLTFTALAETKGEAVTITTQDDTEGIYNMVRDFLKEYNSIINEMDKLYNASSAKGYEPLTDEEKDSMSESEIEEWEEKIKDSLLRRDSNLSSVSSALKEIMAGAITVNGKKMYLSDFGISTAGYFEAADNEKNAYHIDGDADDSYSSGKADKLMTMISNDPDTVVDFFSQLSKNLYSKMDDLSRSVNGYRSFGSFYDDKKMKSDYDDYTTKIADLERKLNDYEDKWYAKFAAMETAMAKMQGNASAITSLLGG